MYVMLLHKKERRNINDVCKALMQLWWYVLLFSFVFCLPVPRSGHLMDEGEDDEFWWCGKNQLSALL